MSKHIPWKTGYIKLQSSERTSLKFWVFDFDTFISRDKKEKNFQ